MTLPLKEILEILCHAFSALLSRDHLPGGIHCDSSAQLTVETKLIPKTNVVSE